MSGGGREAALDEWVHPLIVIRQRRQASRAFVMRYVRQMNFPVSSATFHEGDREDEVRETASTRLRGMRLDSRITEIEAGGVERGRCGSHPRTTSKCLVPMRLKGSMT